MLSTSTNVSFILFKKLQKKEGLPIHCIHHDLRHPLRKSIKGNYDVIFTDPPYTGEGLNLFLSRGISALKKQQGLPIFLSFAHKSPEFMLEMNRSFVKMGLCVTATLPHFNTYIGAQMIANRSQMMILKTTAATQVPKEWSLPYKEPLYTGEVRRSMRTYRCLRCGNDWHVGYKSSMKTIEQLKKTGCPSCHFHSFKHTGKSDS
ncbi:bis-aminopropyl spermidine synthase family protein [Litoribacterium kuwaitense]|uniref:bis-aminopropyl spermidine synthase family protein n=1 Tax=Litoribacterium kuwaitense TaxID=1398745 RepID=UPI0024841664|nr:bis-aminopropyl spermidine synthase family protein [Litoribacterium kuwaitense]